MRDVRILLHGEILTKTIEARRFITRESKSKERAITRPVTEMRDDMFCYIPPHVKVERLDYLHYVTKSEDGSLNSRLMWITTYILLRVAEIDAKNMHRGVLCFERRLAWIEKKR
ncbi:hypothetical protein Bca4012_078428 [Brassica carinata]